MSRVFRKLLAAYKRHGYAIRTGLNPYYLDDADAAFTMPHRRNKAIPVGGGLSPIEIMFLEEMLDVFPSARRILVIGNAYGWSTLALALAKPDAKVVAMDAAIEGNAVRSGSALTERIAREEGLDVTVVEALSPRDVESVVGEHLDGEIDFALIDGLHVNEQLTKDFEAVSRFASPDCVYFLHDVLNWHLLTALRDISGHPKAHSSRILTRLTSGPALVFARSPSEEISSLVDAYVDETFDPYQFIEQQGGSIEYPGPRLLARLPKGYRYAQTGIARTHLAAGNPATALDILRCITVDAPNDAQLSYQAGACLLDGGFADEARPFFEKAAALDSNWGEPAHQLGRIALARGDLTTARQCFDQAIACTRDWAPPYLCTGQVAALQGLPTEADMNFRHAITLEPDWADAHFAYAQFCLHQGDTECAAIHFRHAITLDPDCADAHFAYAQFCLHQGDTECAAIHFRHAITLNPDWADAHFAYAQFCLHQGDTECAAIHFQQTINLAPDRKDVYVIYAELALRQNDFQTALRLIIAIQLFSPDERLLIWDTLEACLAAQTDLTSTISQIDSACAKHPGMRALWKLHGLVLRKAGQMAQAVESFQQALSLVPDWPSVLLEIGITYRDMDNLPKAMQYLIKAKQVRPDLPGLEVSIRSLANHHDR